MEELTEKDIEEWKAIIDGKSHIELASMWRFAKVGHPVFRTGTPVCEHFEKRYRSFGGMTPAISKELGW